MLEKLPVEKWMEFNAKLQQKKNALRSDLRARGILKRDGNNSYDKYKYFSEAQYKELFTELFSKHKLELNFSEIEYQTFDGPEKQANGRMPRIEFMLIDVETGFYESTVITGEGIDKGDKAGYKAYTGALKYFLADKFMVATGDDPEKESPDYNMNRVNSRRGAQQPAQQDFGDPDEPLPISKGQVAAIIKLTTPEQFEALENKYGRDLASMTSEQYVKVLSQIKERLKNKEVSE